MDGMVGVVSERRRRRRWDVQDKVRIVAEAQEPGARVSEVAVRHGVCENLVFTWRRQARDGVLAAPDMPAFMPVQVDEAASTAAGVRLPAEPRPGALPVTARSPAGLIEIELGDGCQVRVGADVSLPALRRVLTALRG